MSHSIDLEPAVAESVYLHALPGKAEQHIPSISGLGEMRSYAFTVVRSGVESALVHLRGT